MIYREKIKGKLAIGQELLYLSMQDVIDTGITVDEIIDLTEKAMIAYSTKKAEMPAKIGLHPQPDSLMHAMPAYLPEEMACGIKWGSNFPTNRERFPELTPTNCQIIYNDHESGLPLAFLDATWITEVRTPAVTLVAAKYLANRDATTFGMFGCGIQGKAHVKMIEHVLPKLETIYVFDVFEKAMDALIEQCQPHVNAKIVKASSYEQVAKSCEVIASAIPIHHHPHPMVKTEWISKGQTLITCDCHSVYEDGVYKKADIYTVDSEEQHRLLETYGYYPWGLPTIYAETGLVAAGDKPGRTSSEQLIVSNNVGMAVEDIIIARKVFDHALEREIGLKLPLWNKTR
ncbi:ornithine cyclodeaminase family protein [Brevibacillus fluminis]|uniref:Ornithine cyclodeaminase family protein n=1 Tax=Brevibacillus fluminis TaxID=511487 RepID=A0A3M8DBS2_9BACL|nr:ornithine cyclodeaminase family protein [Brevibacillus fluminis]RNB84717.1 ornithine cyclodeaminase family protein [Brevibacillus fluminis]